MSRNWIPDPESEIPERLQLPYLTIKEPRLELEQRMSQTASEILGPRVLLVEGDPRAPEDGRWAYEILWSRAATIYAGTSEIQRNIISQRVLGLPR